MSSSSKIPQEIEFESIFTTTITTNPKSKRYDVYLSFCEKELRFVQRIRKALRTYVKEVLVFYDYKKFERRDEVITPSKYSLNVIGECKIAVIIFSKNYTNSISCLQELEKIIECCRTTNGLIVLPVLYPPQPSLQREMFGEPFHDFVHRISMQEISQEEDKFMTWVAAISKAAQYFREFVFIPR